MLTTRFRRLSPLVFLFAVFQALAPAVASVADAWRADERTPYAHVESESGAGCVVVHQHDCALCSIATSAGSAPAVAAGAGSIPCAAATHFAGARAPHDERSRHARSPRAPPTVRG